MSGAVATADLRVSVQVPAQRWRDVQERQSSSEFELAVFPGFCSFVRRLQSWAVKRLAELY